MKRLPLAVISLIIGLIIGGGAGYGISVYSQPKPVVTTQKTVNPPTISELLALVNAERAKHGVAPLTEDQRLDASAQMKANDEVTYHYFGHISPASSPNAGKNSHDYIFSTGISCVDSAENIVENIDPTTGKEYDNTAHGSVNAWIASPPHHAAMIDSKFSLTGFGIDQDQVVEHFCQV